MACIMRDSSSNVVKAYHKRISDSLIILAKCETVHHAITMARRMSIPKAPIHNDAQVAVNAIRGRTSVPKEIITIFGDIKILLSTYRDYSMEYCNRVTNRETDVLAKRPSM